MTRWPAVLASTILMASGSAVWSVPEAAGPQVVSPQSTGNDYGAVLNQDRVTCHNERLKTSGLMLDKASLSNVAAEGEVWEKVVRKLRAGTMPPQGSRRPDRQTYDGLIASLEAALDRAAAASPNPGHPLLHRVNRAEYGNAVRDLLALDVDAASLLPPTMRVTAASTISPMSWASPRCCRSAI